MGSFYLYKLLTNGNYSECELEVQGCTLTVRIMRQTVFYLGLWGWYSCNFYSRAPSTIWGVYG